MYKKRIPMKINLSGTPNSGRKVTGHALLRKDYRGYIWDLSVNEDEESLKQNTYPMFDIGEVISTDEVLSLSALYGSYLSSNTIPDDRLVDITSRLCSTGYKIAFLRGVLQSILSSRLFPTASFKDSLRCEIKAIRLLKPENKLGLVKDVPEFIAFRNANIIRDIASKYLGMDYDYLSEIENNKDEIRYVKRTYSETFNTAEETFDVKDVSHKGEWVKIYNEMNAYIRDNYMSVMGLFKVFQPERFYCLFAFPALNTEQDVKAFREDIVRAWTVRRAIQFNMLLPRMIKSTQINTDNTTVLDNLFTGSDLDLYAGCATYFKTKDLSISPNGKTKNIDKTYYNRISSQFVEEYSDYLSENRITYSSLDLKLMKHCLKTGKSLKQYSTPNDIIIDDIILTDSLKKLIDKHLIERAKYTIVYDNNGKIVFSTSVQTEKEAIIADAIRNNPNTLALYENFDGAIQATEQLIDRLANVRIKNELQKPRTVIYVDCDNCSPIQFLKFIKKLQNVRERIVVNKKELKILPIAIKYILNRRQCKFWDIIADNDFAHYKHTVTEVYGDKNAFKSTCDIVLSMSLYKDILDENVTQPIIVSNDSDFVACIQFACNTTDKIGHKDFSVIHTGSPIKQNYKKTLIELGCSVMNIEHIISDGVTHDSFLLMTMLYIKDYISQTHEKYTSKDLLHKQYIDDILVSYTLTYNLEYITSSLNSVLLQLNIPDHENNINIEKCRASLGKLIEQQGVRNKQEVRG